MPGGKEMELPILITIVEDTCRLERLRDYWSTAVRSGQVRTADIIVSRRSMFVLSLQQILMTCCIAYTSRVTDTI